MTPHPTPASPGRPPALTPSLPAGVWSHELSAASENIAWLWQGYLAPGNVTLLTSQWKAGKTTLLSVLLSQLRKGGDVAGLAVTPGKAVVISEEPNGAWARRHRKLGFGDVCFF